MNNEHYDVIIIGGGPAGLTAGLYTSRAHLKTLLITGNEPGGQLMLTSEVENFPGFPDGILGPELISRLRTQAEKFGAEFLDKNVKSISGDLKAGFTVKTDSDEVYNTKSIIVATGASANWLGLASETKFKGKGVSACAVCDAFFFKNKIVAVIGGGDAAMEEATYLTKFASKVYVIVRKESLKASKVMQERARQNEKIEFIFNSEVFEVLGDKVVTGIKVLNNKDLKESTITVDGLFVAIGHTPNTGFLKGFLELDKKGYIVVKDNTKSSVPGVLVAGDVSDYKYRQAITAAGLGTMAALDAEKLLAE